MVFSYNTTFSHLCHAVCTPLCTNLLSVHTHVVRVLNDHNQTLYGESVSFACAPVAFCYWEILRAIEPLISEKLQQVPYPDKPT